MNEDSKDPALVPQPFWKSKTFWATLLSVILAAPTFVQQIAPFLTEDQRQKALALAAVLAAIGSLFARKGGVEAAKQAVAAHEKATGLQGLTQSPTGAPSGAGETTE